MTALVVAAHPDDEVLGCGGTVARLAAEGRDVHVLIMAEGATSRDDSRDAARRAGEMDRLRTAAAAAAAALGTKPPRFAGFPDNRMDGLERLDIIKVVERLVEEVRPSLVLTHHGNDLNVDHRLTHEAVLTACRPQPGCPVRTILAFETLSSTEWGASAQGAAFTPHQFYDISDSLTRKLAALGAYAAEMRPFPHARSLEAVTALARWRGSTIGVAAAEAFQMVRSIL